MGARTRADRVTRRSAESRGQYAQHLPGDAHQNPGGCSSPSACASDMYREDSELLHVTRAVHESPRARAGTSLDASAEPRSRFPATECDSRSRRPGARKLRVEEE